MLASAGKAVYDFIQWLVETGGWQSAVVGFLAAAVAFWFIDTQTTVNPTNDFVFTAVVLGFGAVCGLGMAGFMERRKERGKAKDAE